MAEVIANGGIRLDLASAMSKLEALGTEQSRKTYRNHGAQEPLFGVTLRDMKPLAKKIKKDHALAMELYATGNYDAQTLAGILAKPDKMTAADFERWMETANCRATADYVVAVTLAETDFAEELADRWINSEDENAQSAGWNCYCRLLRSRPDEQFDRGKLNKMLQRVVRGIHGQSNWVKYAMNNFVISVGISYLPLHKEAMKAALKIGAVSVDHGNTSCKTPLAADSLRKAEEKQRLGFKKRNARC